MEDKKHIYTAPLIDIVFFGAENQTSDTSSWSETPDPWVETPPEEA